MNTELQIAINDFLKKCPIDNAVAVTLTMKQTGVWGNIDPMVASRNFRDFMNFLNKAVYKNAFTRYNKRLNVISVNEVRNRSHYHCVIEKPDRSYMSNHDFYVLLEACWKKTFYGYNENRIATNIDHGWINYITKFKDTNDSIDWENTTY